MAAITLAWGDGQHAFRLRIAELVELERQCDCGVFELYQRLAGGKWRTRDAREILRLGLVGGGMAPAGALGLVAHYCDERPLLENIEPALAVLLAALSGVPGKNQPAAAGEPTPAASISPASTDSEP
jgi:hypothetical protein